MSHQDFVSSLLPVAQQYEQQTGIPAAAFIAIAASESNWGAAGGNELFGIKGSGLIASTWEQVSGQSVPTVASFQTYSSPEAAFESFVSLVSGGRYQSAWTAFQNSGDWRQFLRDINAAGYATDPSWAVKIISLAENTIQPMIGGSLGAAPLAGGSGSGSGINGGTGFPSKGAVALGIGLLAIIWLIGD